MCTLRCIFWGVHEEVFDIIAVYVTKMTLRGILEA
jgi:hypothetical protein